MPLLEFFATKDMSVYGMLGYDPSIAHSLFWVTTLGSLPVMVAISCSICIMLWLWRESEYVMRLVIAVLGASITTALLKLIVHRPRPEFALVTESSFSFPSGHASAAMALYGTLIYILLRATKNRFAKIIVVAAGIVFIIAIGFSRVYLGVHSFSDVIMGYIVGLFWILIAHVLSRFPPFVVWFRHDSHARHVPRTKEIQYLILTVVSCLTAVTFVLWGLYTVSDLRTNLAHELLDMNN